MYKVVSGYYPIMQKLSRILSQLDVVATIATVISSSSGKWCRPTFSQKGIIGRKLHHPSVKNCIPNDAIMQDGCRTIVLTGPNMGGKSTFIRTIGLATYLSHIGCYVPAQKFQCQIIDSIITRVGASDMQSKGISTFMSEMMQSYTMINSASNKSLVLIDQLGRGTSTSQGFGLAWGICQYVHQKIGSYCLFATHFHEMTRMADQLKGVKNMYTSCQIVDDNLKLQYKVIQGKIQKSHGIQVAKMLNFPQQVVNVAKAYLRVYQNNQQQQDSQFKQLNQNQKKAISIYQQMNAITNITQQLKEQYRKKIKQLI